MIEKIIMNPDENLRPAVVEWDDGIEDYTISVPDGISRQDLIEFVDELKRITSWED